MKLYVCWGTFPMGPHTHPCQTSDTALCEAGYSPKVIKTYGYGLLPAILNPLRKPVRDLTGQQLVPVLELDDGTAIQGSKKIIAWAAANPAAKAAT